MLREADQSLCSSGSMRRCKSGENVILMKLLKRSSGKAQYFYSNGPDRRREAIMSARSSLKKTNREGNDCLRLLFSFFSFRDVSLRSALVGLQGSEDWIWTWCNFRHFFSCCGSQSRWWVSVFRYAPTALGSAPEQQDAKQHCHLCPYTTVCSPALCRMEDLPQLFSAESHSTKVCELLGWRDGRCTEADRAQAEVRMRLIKVNGGNYGTLKSVSARLQQFEAWLSHVNTQALHTLRMSSTTPNQHPAFFIYSYISMCV